MGREAVMQNRITDKIKNILNIFLYLAALWTGLAMVFLCLKSKSIYRETSESIFGQGSPLMNSNFLEVTASFPTALFLTVLLLIVAFKRYFIKNFNLSMTINGVSLLFFSLFAAIFNYFLYLPILHL